MRAKVACALAIVASSTWLISRSASAQASAAVSRTMTWSRMPKLNLRPRFAAASWAVASFCATSAGGSPQVR